MNLLLTGATGVLGSELVRSLTRVRPGWTLHVLLRARDDEELRVRLAGIRAGLDPESARRVVAVRGDVTADRLGLGDGYHALARSMDAIYHAAACTRFDAPVAVASAHNVAGTRRVLALARLSQRAGRSGRVHYVSTAYVSGRRAGCVTESELDCGQQFSNAYEWSKFQAERDVRSAGVDLPVTIYRPSVIVGDSRTGRALRFLGVYQVLSWIHRGYVRALPCRREFELDLAPVDYVADAIAALSIEPGSVGRTFHVTAGRGNTLPVEELVDIFLRERRAWVTADRESRLASLRFEGSPDEARYARLTRYLPYLTWPKTFDDGNTRAMLGGAGAPSCRDFFPRVVRYALANGFRA